MKDYYVYTRKTVRDLIDLFECVSDGTYSDTLARAQELAAEWSSEQGCAVKVYRLSCEEVR